MSDVQPIPSGHPAIVPHLVVRGAAEAIDFYIKAFGADEVARMTMPDGKGIMHAELKIGTARIFICDETPTMERWVSPRSLNGTTVTLNLWTDKADEIFAQAVKAGAKVVMPLADMFWGDRYGRVTDPFGHEWAIAQHVRDLSPEEMAKAAAKKPASENS
jgi:PhnB protein